MAMAIWLLFEITAAGDVPAAAQTFTRDMHVLMRHHIVCMHVVPGWIVQNKATHCPVCVSEGYCSTCEVLMPRHSFLPKRTRKCMQAESLSN